MEERRASPGILVEHVPLPTWELDLLQAERRDVVVLPRKVRDGLGEYRDSDLPAVQALRDAGINIGWAHPAPKRTFASEYGAEVAFAFGLFVAQALGQEGVAEFGRWLLARVRDAIASRRRDGQGPTFVIDVARLSVEGNRREIEGLRVIAHGDAAKFDPVQFVDVVASLLRGDPPPP